jgi:hypothetical protein
MPSPRLRRCKRRRLRQPTRGEAGEPVVRKRRCPVRLGLILLLAPQARAEIRPLNLGFLREWRYYPRIRSNARFRRLSASKIAGRIDRPITESIASQTERERPLFAHSGRLESTLSGHCVIAAAAVVIRASGHFIGASWSVQFRWMQPLGKELRSGLQLSSNARTAHAERLIASRAART